MKTGRIPAVLAAALAAAILVVLPARAATASFGDCSPPSGLAAKTPVILVHGYTGQPGDWGDPGTSGTMFHALERMSDRLYVETFDWSSTNTSWVSNPNEGPRLAARIDCLSQASIANGGPGKVILVAHSMGGLMVRYAASFSLRGRLVSNEIGLVVTIGTPNLGSAWATWIDPLVATICATADSTNPWRDADTSYCPDYSALMGLSQDSNLINNLPWLPPDIPVRAIAGDVTLTAPLLHSVANNDTQGDLLVGVSSALAAKHASAPLYEGAGNSTFQCTASVANWKSAPCWHAGLLSNPAVQQKVTDSIRAYLRNGPWEPFMTGNGKWHVHTNTLTLVPRGTSTATWNVGPCLGQNDGFGSQPEMCTATVHLVFQPAGSGLLGTITNGGVTYTTWSGDPLPSGFVPPDGGPQAGQTIKLVATQYPHVLKSVDTDNSPGILSGGNPYLCQPGAPQWLVLKGDCGA